MTTRNLAERQSDGLTVSLDWSKSTGEVFVSIEDTKEGYSYPATKVSSHLALDAFNHPFAYVGVSDNPQSIDPGRILH